MEINISNPNNNYENEQTDHLRCLKLTQSVTNMVEDMFHYYEQTGLGEYYFKNLQGKILQKKNVIKLVNNRLLKLKPAKLHIVDCDLNSIGIREMITSMKNIRFLDLSSNRFNTKEALALSDALIDNNIIETLNISNNRICGEYIAHNRAIGSPDLRGLESLCESFITCSNLKYIDLSFNYIGGLNIDRAESNLRHFENDWLFSRKTLKLLCNLLRQSTSIIDLNITNNGFEENDASSILSLVGSNYSCQSLIGRIYRFTESNWDQTKSFDFSSKALDSSSGIFIGYELATDSTCTDLNMHLNSQFGGLGIDKIMTGLLLNKNICENINLVQLDLSNCNITYITPQFLACTKFRFIEKFDFSYNRLADDAQVKLFFNQLTNLPILAHLNITEINITSKTCKQLRNYLELSKSLKSLDISDNEIKDEGLSIILTDTILPPFLEKLILHNTCISSEGVLMIADKIANHAKYFPVLELNLSGNDSICGSRLLETFNPQPIFRLSESLRNTAAILKKLDLSWNDIGARAADHLMVTLQMNQLLETLVLKRSHVGALGAEQISSALPNMAGLRWLDISDCNLGSDGLMNIFQGLSMNTSLLGLDISNNPLYDPFVDVNGFNLLAHSAFFNTISVNNSLQYLNIRSNGFMFEDANSSYLEEFANALKKNTSLRSINLIGNTGDWRNIPIFGTIHNSNTIDDVLTQSIANHPNLKSVVGKLYPRWSGVQQSIIPLGGPILSVENYIPQTTACYEMSSFISPTDYRTLILLDVELGRQDRLLGLIRDEIAYNHFLVEVIVRNRNVAEEISGSIESNFNLRKLQYAISRTNLSINSHALIEQRKLKSFYQRVGLAIFLRGKCHKLPEQLVKIILEYLMSPGPLINKFCKNYL